MWVSFVMELLKYRSDITVNQSERRFITNLPDSKLLLGAYRIDYFIGETPISADVGFELLHGRFSIYGEISRVALMLLENLYRIGEEGLLT